MHAETIERPDTPDTASCSPVCSDERLPCLRVSLHRFSAGQFLLDEALA